MCLCARLALTLTSACMIRSSELVLGVQCLGLTHLKWTLLKHILFIHDLTHNAVMLCTQCMCVTLTILFFIAVRLPEGSDKKMLENTLSVEVSDESVFK